MSEAYFYVFFLILFFSSPPPAPVRIRFWMSTRQIDSKQRLEYFWKLIKAWPDDWERRAVTWSKTGISVTNICTAFYIGK